jgi:hypothetical protein
MVFENLPGTDAASNEAKDRSVRRGLVTAAYGTAVSSALAFGAAKMLGPRIGLSGKTAIFISGPIFGFMIGAEKSVIMDQRRAKLYNSRYYQQHKDDPDAVDAEGYEPAPKQSMAEYVRTHPFGPLAAVGVPAVAAIGYRSVTKEHGAGRPLSLKLMHTRVIGQASVLALLVALMLYAGKSPSGWDRASEERHAAERRVIEANNARHAAESAH